MRRGLLIVTMVMTMLCIPSVARADGGAYIEFGRTHYLPGETATGEAYVYLLKRQQGLLDRGPFYAYLLASGTFPRVGEPIPAGDIRVGTFAVEESRPKWFELRVSFTVPDVTGDFYSVALCNDPCTVQGFKEPLIGLISIVQTQREGALLTQRQRLISRVYALRRAGKKQAKAMAALQERFTTVDRERSTMANEIGVLQDRLAATAAASERAREPRPLLAPSTGIVVVLVLSAITALFAGRKTRLAVHPPPG